METNQLISTGGQWKQITAHFHRRPIETNRCSFQYPREGSVSVRVLLLLGSGDGGHVGWVEAEGGGERGVEEEEARSDRHQSLSFFFSFFFASPPVCLSGPWLIETRAKCSVLQSSHSQTAFSRPAFPCRRCADSAGTDTGWRHGTARHCRRPSLPCSRFNNRLFVPPNTALSSLSPPR